MRDITNSSASMGQDADTGYCAAYRSRGGTAAQRTGRPHQLGYERDVQPLLAARASCVRGGYGIITFVALPDGTPAAVKQLRTDRAASASRAATLVKEVSSLELLPPHANVVTLLGHCWQSVGVYALVYERASHGDLGSARGAQGPEQSRANGRRAGRCWPRPCTHARARLGSCRCEGVQCPCVARCQRCARKASRLRAVQCVARSNIR